MTLILWKAPVVDDPDEVKELLPPYIIGGFFFSVIVFLLVVVLSGTKTERAR